MSKKRKLFSKLILIAFTTSLLSNMQVSASGKSSEIISDSVNLITTQDSVKISDDVDLSLDEEKEVREINEQIYINPIYKDLDINFEENISMYSRVSVPTFNSVESAGEYMRKQMIYREATISFIINKNYYNELGEDIYNYAVKHTKNCSSTEGDYLLAHFGGCRVSGSYVGDTVQLTYNMNYLSTYEQEKKVGQEIESVLDRLDVYDADEYTKIKAVHDYIVSNIDYDYSFQKYSAYNAIVEKKVVCQGFASLTYRMLKELDVDVRYISGTGNGGAHGWNIVKIDGKWYNLDNTWDENYGQSYGTIRYDWFLKSNADFPKHSRDSEYNTSDFNKQYVMSKTSYVPSKEIKVKSITLNATSFPNWKVGASGTFKATVSPSNASNKGLTWTSSNPKVATVDQNGRLTGIASGSTTITCTAKDGSGVKATCKVTVVNSV